MTRYAGPVVDAHHHFWEPSRGFQPWLRPGVRIPFRYGDYESIKRDFMPADLRAEAATAGIDLVGSVTMETEWDESDPVGEMRYTAAIAERDGLPDAAVAHAVLQDACVGPTLEELAALHVRGRRFVAGVRQKPGQSSDPTHPDATLLSDPAWQRGFVGLAAHGLHFELQTAWWQLDEAFPLFAANPAIPVVINHAALPSDRSAEAMGGWRAAVGRIAELEHVSMKISGIGLPGVPWTVDVNRPVVEGLVDAFGTDRVLFASNFPVDSLAGSYADIYGGFLDITSSWSTSEQRAAFAGNAVSIYRLDPALIAP
jgi:predicted TIM-barrel fold metal-dependent hydrolase